MARSVVRTLLVVTAIVLGTHDAFAGFAGTDVFLASVGRRAGAAGSSWFTTVWVHNPGTTAANVQFFFLERDRENTAAIPYNDVIQPGDTVRYDDAVAQMFGVEKFGALRVVSDTRLVVNSRIYSQPEGSEPRDSQGQFFAAVPADFALATGESTELLGAYQTDPKAESQFRYNFGFVETTGASARVRVTASDATGVAIGTRDYDLRPLEPRQFPLEDLLPGVNASNLRLTVSVLSGEGRVIAFGSGLANRSNDPSTFEMQFQDGLLVANRTISHDGSLTGDGSAAAPLGIAGGGVEARHLAPGTAVTSLNGASEDVTISGSSGIEVATVGNSITLSAPSSPCPQCIAEAVFNEATQPLTRTTAVFTTAPGKTRYVTGLSVALSCSSGTWTKLDLSIDGDNVLLLTQTVPSWSSGGGAPIVVGEGSRLESTLVGDTGCRGLLTVTGFEF